MLFMKKGLKKASKEDDQTFSQRMQENAVGKSDMFAMIVSAFLVIVLPCLLVLLAFAGLVMLLFGIMA